MSQDFQGNNANDPPRLIPRGCLLSIGSALITCLMLFINGSLVLAFLAAFTRFGPEWMHNPRFAQFMLYLVPVLLVVVEWMMIDYVRSRFQQNTDD